MPDNNLKVHNLTLENREFLRLTGVNDVYGFNEESISISTELGGLLVKGSNLHISKLDLSSGNVEIHGKISAFQYVHSKTNKSMIQRLFS